MPKNIVKRIKKFNKDREPELLKLKYEALTESPFRFFRGTCHLFYDDLPQKSFIFNSPKAWICGDLHLENFGSFKGDNRLAYFDMNDFDESLLAPCLMDVVRLCTSIFLSAGLVKMTRQECGELVKAFLQSYAKNLSAGYIKFIEQETARGFVRDFLDNVATRKRKDLLAKRVTLSGSKAHIKFIELKAFKAKAEIKEKVKGIINAWAEKNTRHPEFFKVMDVAGRAIGTGSIGVERYLILVNGNGKHDGRYLLDIKEVMPPSALYFHKLKQPNWKNEADRLINIQKRVQASPPAFLNPVKIDKKWFVMKELQPLEDKIDFRFLEKDPKKFNQLLTDMGAIVAWNNLRSSGRQGSAIADELIRFGKRLNKIEPAIINYAEEYAQTTEKYWGEYKKAYGAGKLKLT